MQITRVKPTGLRPLTSKGESGAPREWVLVAAMGENPTRKGAFKLTPDAAAKAIAEFASHGVKIPIDYEHQTLGGSFASPNGQAPAAGWVDELKAFTAAEAPHDGVAGLWAHVEWTSQAFDQIAAKQYAYLSPVIEVDSKTREVLSLHSLALTNTPAMKGAPRLAAKVMAHGAPMGGGTGGSKMGMPAGGMGNAGSGDNVQDTAELLQKLRAGVGVPEGASVNEILNAVLQKLGGNMATPDTNPPTVPPIDDDKTKKPPQAQANKSDAPSGELVALKTQLESQNLEIGQLQERLRKTEWESFCADQVRAGKLTHGELKTSGDSLYKFYTSDKPACMAMITGRQPVVAQGATDEPAGGTDSKKARIIAAARKEWQDNVGLQQLTDEDSHVVSELVAHGVISHEKLLALKDDARKALIA